MTTKVRIGELLEGLTQIFSEEFANEQVVKYLRHNPIEMDSLTPYVRFTERAYARNLIHKDSLFEAVLLCWGPGQHSLVHRHTDQLGWVQVVKGKLVITNYSKLRSEGTESVQPEISWTRMDSVYLREGHSQSLAEGEIYQEVDQPETIHKAENPTSFQQESISLHICYRPSTTAVIYDVENHRCRTVRMGYV